MAGPGVPTTRPARRRPARFSASKFTAPALTSAHVARPHLCARLDEAPATTVRVVVGSPGSGKTTLLTEWSHRRTGTTAWVNADSADRDPVRFWQGAIDALRQVIPGFAEEAYDRLTLDGSVEPDALESILSSAESLGGEAVLVVDDFHLVSADVHEHLRFLGRRGTGQLMFALGTRTEPRIGLDRLRMQGRLCEVRDNDLRLSPDEALALCRELSPGVASGTVQALRERTEGWAAGMQLAAVALQSSDEPSEFLRRFAGTSQVITQYLAAELVDTQPPEIQRFLLDTCIVDELTPGLAAELSPGSPVGLADIEAAHLLLSRLDSEGTAFRYHHLFADMLRYRLAASDPSHERVLHERAARWFVGAGDLTAAFRHRWRAGDPGEAMALIHGHVLSEYLAGHAPEVSGARGALSDADVLNAPGPSVSYCGALFLEGQLDAAAKLLDRVEALAGSRLSPPDQVQLLATRTAIDAAQCDTTATLEHGMATLTTAGAAGLENDWTIAATAFVVRAHGWRGAFGEGEAVAAALDLDQPIQAIEAKSAVAFLRSEEGRLSEAYELASEAASTATASDVEGSTVDAPTRTVLGGILLERGHPERAEPMLRAISDLTTNLRGPMIVLARIGLSRIWAAEGNFDAARQILESARTAAPCALEASAPAVRQRVAEGRLALRTGDPDHAAAIVDLLPSGSERTLLDARVQAAVGPPRLATKLIEDLVPVMTTARQRLELALLRLEVACCCDEDDQEVASLAGTVLDLAEPEGFLFVIPESGAGVLDAVCRIARRRPRTLYLDQLLVTRPYAVPDARATVEFAIDALSERERTVLRYLVTAMSYREIADDMYISVNTVKTHVKNIIRKLHAEGRADAIERARSLHYI